MGNPMKMKPTYEPYWLWEDYLHGMYEVRPGVDEEYLIGLAFELLSCEPRFASACVEVIEQWPIATSVNLTNLNCNRRAWLGQAACNWKHGVPEILTRAAWKSLTNQQRLVANSIAGDLIRGYETARRELHRSMEAPGLF